MSPVQNSTASPPNNAESLVLDARRRDECREAIVALLERTPALLFASVATVDGRSYTHADSALHEINPLRCAAIMSSLMGLVESFCRETLKSRALYSSIATEHGSIVIVRIPTRSKLHALCVCSDATENLAMTIRAALDTAAALAEKIDAS